jgi:hypothetical protein
MKTTTNEHSVGVVPASLFLATVQLLVGVGVWFLGPMPVIAVIASVGYAAWCLFVAHWDVLFGGGKGFFQRILILTLWQLPALITGTWAMLTFFGLAPRCDIGVVVLQIWLEPFAPLWSLLPGIMIHGRGLYLWFLCLLPWILVIGLSILAQRHARKPRN